MVAADCREVSFTKPTFQQESLSNNSLQIKKISEKFHIFYSLARKNFQASRKSSAPVFMTSNIPTASGWISSADCLAFVWFEINGSRIEESEREGCSISCMEGVEDTGRRGILFWERKGMFSGEGKKEKKRGDVNSDSDHGTEFHQRMK
ncbi:hypothetical protein HNY73_006671 [Argiope bruennichi]|uniref:Uncharacterized protein n=1 Tax=Argiope bruennichi TaxID=94029 RepID=A0A8T0FH41_ARGBR|nr:hypothetical protein HNY73_006671 [Argiope bruennichi]